MCNYNKKVTRIGDVNHMHFFQPSYVSDLPPAWRVIFNVLSSFCDYNQYRKNISYGGINTKASSLAVGSSFSTLVDIDASLYPSIVASASPTLAASVAIRTRSALETTVEVTTRYQFITRTDQIAFIHIDASMTWEGKIGVALEVIFVFVLN